MKKTIYQNLRKPYELIVVGVGGLIGSSALYQAAKRVASVKKTGVTFFTAPKVLGIEQYSTHHTLGSSHGETRMTRLANAEGPQYVALAKRSNELWREIEHETQGAFGSLSHKTGGLIIGPITKESELHGAREGFLKSTQICAQQFNISHDNLDFINLKKKFPQFKLEAKESAYYEPSMGLLYPETCIKAQLNLAKIHGAEINTYEKFTQFERSSTGKIRVITSQGEYETNKLIISAGPWTASLLELPHLKVYRQTVFYFKIKEGFRENFLPDKFVPFIRDLGKKGMVYGFPIINNAQAIKIGRECYDQPTTPKQMSREVSEKEKNDMYYNFIEPYFHTIDNHCLQATVCSYTVAPRWQFMVDFYPGYENEVMVVSACSGHRAKHSAALGEALSEQMLLGESSIDIMKLFSNSLKKPDLALNTL